MSTPSPRDEFSEAMGHALGFVIAAVGCLVGGGLLVFVAAAIFFRLLYGG